MRQPQLFSGLLFLTTLLLFGCSSTGSSDDPEGNGSSSSLSDPASDGTTSSSSLSSSSAVSSSSLSSSSSVPGSSSSQDESEWCETAGNCGTFTDLRDSTTYNWIKIGNQVWMAQNLNFGTRVAGSADQTDATESSAEKYCHNDDESNCDTDGGLYQWHSAMALQDSCNTTLGCTVNTPHRGICPEEWHIPTQAEWATLTEWVDRDNDGMVNQNEGTSLKSISGWVGNGNGTDDYGWTGLPGGYSYGGRFSNQGNNGYWWSASESNADYAWSRYLDSYEDSLREDGYGKYGSGFSVRCVQD